VVGYSKSPSTTERARQLGVIDVAAPSALLAVSGADLVLLAVPVAASEATFKAIRHGMSNDTLVMDVGSTKGDVIEAARRGLGDRSSPTSCRPPDRRQGGRAGIEHAEATLLRGPPGRPDACEGHAALERAARLADVWSGIGANVVTMTPKSTTAAFAAVSHLPHLLAFAYINALVAQPEGDRFLSSQAPVFATSPASPPAIRSCGATCCWPTASRCCCSRRPSARRC
jgi:prephenate dehydrogenase